MGRHGFVISRCSEGQGQPHEGKSHAAPSPVLRPNALLPPLMSDILPPAVCLAIQSVLAEGYTGWLEEIRLRAQRRASLTVGGINVMMDVVMTSAELFSLLTHMCGGSLYAYSQNINEGFITLSGGIRVGVAGEATCEGGQVIGVREISSLCIRIPHEHGDAGKKISDMLRDMMQNRGSPAGILLYAPPGVGKTTLLRGVTAHLAGGKQPLRTVVVDTRGELTFPTGGEGLCLDVLTGYPRALGVGIATRSLGAQVIVCDEIGDYREALALMTAYHGGVPLLATAHGKTVGELLQRTGLRLLHKAGLFGAYVGIRRDGYGGFLYDMTYREEADHAL